MPDRIVTGILLTIFLSLTACGPSRLEPLTTPARSGRSAVRLTQSGGFAGIHLIIDVAISGEMTAQDVRSGRAASGMLSSAALEQLDGLTAAIHLATNAAPTSNCADCFIYEIEVYSAHGTFRRQVDDTTLGASGLEPLITYLRQLRDDALEGAQ